MGEDARELERAHYEEVVSRKDVFALDPDYDAYLRLEAVGALHTITAREGGKLIGYVTLFVHQHLHYRRAKTAIEDVHFLHPDYRSGSAGYRLLRFAEARMREIGCDVMTLRTKITHNHGLVFQRMGFEAMDMVYLKRLNPGS